ncbi:MAG TPA: DNA-3-methyladenine glycosylase [Acidimicrobiales bacterium]|nr:DNA-3-methyladenine glycosylase [Acidimicrobiales bacterium]
MAPAQVLPRSFYARDARAVAPELLNKLLVRGDRVGRIVEVEAYCGADDPGSHAYRGPTPRNATMFGPPGHLYVYFTYGMHHCANAVCGMEGTATAVLLRALDVVSGVHDMRVAYPGLRRDADLCRGPARLCKAFGIDRSFDGADLVSGDLGVTVVDDGMPPPAAPGIGVRVGLTAGADLPWRFTVPGAPGLSRPV